MDSKYVVLDEAQSKLLRARFYDIFNKYEEIYAEYEKIGTYVANIGDRIRSETIRKEYILLYENLETNNVIENNNKVVVFKNSGYEDFLNDTVYEYIKATHSSKLKYIAECIEGFMK